VGISGVVRRHWDWIGLAAGAAIGMLDYGLFLAMGSPELAPLRPERFAVGLALAFGALGFAVGRLALARQRARRDAETITSQLHELEDTQQRLVQQEKLAAIGRLAAGVAHEVRNPLGVIRASAKMVQESFAAGDDRWRACEFVAEETDRLNALITALLTFSRPTAPRLIEADLARVVDRALELARPAIERRHVRVEREASAALPGLRADPDLLSQVLLDLVLNAIESVAPGGRVAVRADAVDGRLVVEVADDGPGVPPGERESIFEPFVTTKSRGTGLGLPMALRIAEAHGGSLAYVPEAGLGPRGAGACFRVSVPVAVAKGATP
jgi:two-component system sensor histidine kinase HydH